MNKLEREITLVMGMTGWGKSWWSKLYCLKWPNLLVYDPAMSFPEVVWGNMSEHIDPMIGEEKLPHYRLGFVDHEEVAQGASASFVRGDSMFMIEECATVFDKGQARLPDWGKRLCFYGRHRECSLTLIAQRPTYIPIDLRSQANRVISFCQHEDGDIQWLGDFYGKERMNRILTVPKFTCFDWHNGNVTEYSIVEQVKETFGVTLDRSNTSSLTLV
jgi:hypothetical protein